MPAVGADIHRLLPQIQRLQLKGQVQPLTPSVIRIELQMDGDFVWDEHSHGQLHQLPKYRHKTQLLDLQPLPPADRHFTFGGILFLNNVIQTQTLAALDNSNEHVLLCAPSFSGKTKMAEVVLCKCVYLTATHWLRAFESGDVPAHGPLAGRSQEAGARAHHHCRAQALRQGAARLAQAQGDPQN